MTLGEKLTLDPKDEKYYRVKTDTNYFVDP